MHRTITLLVLSLISCGFFQRAVVAAPSRSEGTETVYARTENSVFTIEVHTGNRDTKSTLGSGYLVSQDGKIATNFHVIESFVYQPKRYHIRVKNKLGEFSAELLNFDVINDLAVLKIDSVASRPLSVVHSRSTPLGSSIVALGNPLGLHLSIIRGIFNGYAEKGLIDRMLLSMPLNSGMSGGPILDDGGRVIGTNVSVIWLSNSLSFGVPSSKLLPLLQASSLKKDKENYLTEIRRQFIAIESETMQRIKTSYEARKKIERVQVGDAEFDRLADLFDCWDTSKTNDEKGISKATYSCNLQFTPSLSGYHEIASIELFVEHLSTKENSLGFYGYLSQHGAAHHDIREKTVHEDVEITAPHCTADRVHYETQTWMINTCINAYPDFSELYDFAMVATTVNRPKEAIYVALHMNGFRLESYLHLSQLFLKHMRFAVKR